MFVVYEVRFWNETPQGDYNLRSKLNRLKEFNTLEEANEFMQGKMDVARETWAETSYTIIMEP